MFGPPSKPMQGAGGLPAMLRAALIGLPATGKTTLFQLMTAVREAGRAVHGRGEVQIGISKVPDPRLDRLSAMFTPKKHTPATVEFADLAGATGGAKALVDVVAYKNADALVHVVRAFTDQAVPHVSESWTRRATRRRWTTSSYWLTSGSSSAGSNGWTRT